MYAISENILEYPLELVHHDVQSIVHRTWLTWILSAKERVPCQRRVGMAARQDADRAR